MEYAVDPAQRGPAGGSVTSDPTALLTSQFLPYFVPGFSPTYAPVIPRRLQSGYLQPMYGMEGLLPTALRAVAGPDGAVPGPPCSSTSNTSRVCRRPSSSSSNGNYSSSSKKCSSSPKQAKPQPPAASQTKTLPKNPQTRRAENAPREVSPSPAETSQEPEAESKGLPPIPSLFQRCSTVGLPQVPGGLLVTQEAAREPPEVLLLLRPVCGEPARDGASRPHGRRRRWQRRQAAVAPVPLPGVAERAVWGGSLESTSRVGLAQTQNNHESSKKTPKST